MEPIVDVKFSFRAWQPLSPAVVVSVLRQNNEPAWWITTDISGVWVHRRKVNRSEDESTLLHRFPRRPSPFTYLSVHIHWQDPLVIVFAGRMPTIFSLQPSPSKLAQVVFGLPPARVAGLQPFHGHLKNVVIDGRYAIGPIANGFNLSAVINEEPFSTYTTHFEDSLVRIPIPVLPAQASFSFLSNPRVGMALSPQTLAAVRSGNITLVRFEVSNTSKLVAIDERSRSEQALPEGSKKWHAVRLVITSSGLPGFELWDQGALLTYRLITSDTNLYLHLGKETQASQSSSAFSGCLRSVTVNNRSTDIIASKGQQLGTNPTTSGEETSLRSWIGMYTCILLPRICCITTKFCAGKFSTKPSIDLLCRTYFYEHA